MFTVLIQIFIFDLYYTKMHIQITKSPKETNNNVWTSYNDNV